ncbi:MAG: UDP-N-acetylmuramoyl-L-alanyl-D-glutamate--2,6-diaminopimelate ligase [Clostridia bacterium]|nr:UDP-N-acetylmuramoyl-L-alanyl-D-glutamate--2,6-diaminopimelate ligase [Clostridia bacterium]
MRLSSLLKNVKIIDKINYFDCEIDELSLSSKEVFSKSLFFAVKGNNTDGNLYIDEAISRGAKVIVSSKKSDRKICQIIVDDMPSTISKIAKNFYICDKKMPKIIGVVGTNGKTTTTFMIKSILETAGYKVGVIGTLGAYYGNAFVSPELTTPSALGFYELIKNMIDARVEYVIIEYSAHAIAQNRLGNVKFECLIFTNCTQDHLDYFKEFSIYEKTKISAFTKENCRFAVVNSDDKTGIKILNESTAKIFTYGIENPADVFAINVKNSPNGVSFIINAFDEISNLSYKGAGTFNVYNALASATCTAVLGVSLFDINKGLSAIDSVSGRMEFVESYNGANIYIDYAHTPDGLENLLKALKEITKKKLILVFGCGGNRDTKKRPIMGEIAGKYADFIVITSDNPRYEEPYHIISQIEKGVRKNTLSYITIQNRKMAIGYAVEKLLPGDTLVVAGKGAEEYQEIMGIKNKFSDKDEIKDAICKIKFSGELF